MFHHHRNDTPDPPIVHPQVRTVRLLQGDEELQAAVERASAFERRGIDDSQRRIGTYDRLLGDGEGQLANVVLIGALRGDPAQEREHVADTSDADNAPVLTEAGE
jgi:hypothetical protein